jgi:hypothetical protein
MGGFYYYMEEATFKRVKLMTPIPEHPTAFYIDSFTDGGRSYVEIVSKDNEVLDLFTETL